MITKRLVASIVCITTLWPQLSKAANNKPLAENIAALAVAKKWCGDYEVDLESGVRLAIAKGINPLKGEFNRLIDETKEKLEGHMGDLGVKKFCEITYERYRPGGPVPGFMMKK
ncbi:hypothetical protein [Methylobacterium indicum]|uniref:hypothetical protein n=1 Tax=Methylobacterium indicum TaxID=1775910 RepID=UPI000A8F07B2|nr:hypothetical protein [Methylobacterium indicum]